MAVKVNRDNIRGDKNFKKLQQEKLGETFAICITVNFYNV